MGDASQAIAIRNRIIGALVKRARLKAGRTQRECANLLGCSLFTFIQYEQGHAGLSLSQLEALAGLLKVPLENLWDETRALPEEPAEDPAIVQQALLLRRKMLAIQIRQSRRAAGLTQEQMARLLGHSPTLIAQYEQGERDVPLSELEIVAETCGRTLADFLDKPPAVPEESGDGRAALAALNELPPDVRDFVLKPTNVLYLRIALLVSSMRADSLRQIAETLLDITY